MKKILFAVLALATMASCSNEYTVDYNKEVIAFGETFVDNATKADYNAGNHVTAFKVWGTATGTHTGATAVQIFNGDDVKNTDGTTTVDYNGVWFCDNVQYWVPNAEYEFAAIVDGVAETTSTLPATIKHTVVTGNEDLLYATATASVNNAGTVTGLTDGTNLVPFTFDHLLSKVYFTITEDAPAGYDFKVTSIAVSGIENKGVYTIAGETWAKDAASTKITLDFASDSHQILPLEQTLNIVVTYDTEYNGQKVSTATKSGEINGYTFKANTSYNVAATLSLEKEIKFTVDTVNGFTAAGSDFDI